MSEALKLILRAPIERDQDGWWHHPDGPEFEEDVAAFKAWLVQQGLELQQWHMDSDIGEQHPYADGDCHCLGWKPECPGPEWFLLGIFDTEEGPCVSWVRRKAEEAWSLNGVDGSWDYPNLTALIRDNFGSAAEGTSFGPGLGNGLKVGDTVHSGTVCKADPAVFLTDGDELLNHMFGAAAGSDAGEWVDNYGKRMSWPMLRNGWADAREAARTKAEVEKKPDLANRIAQFQSQSQSQFRDIRPKAASEINDLNEASLLLGHSKEGITERVYRRVGAIAKPSK